ncbi:hypothetical protein MUG84_24500 [Paenibacillus sp. KQZ6P-2]|uniref:Uncharacterized protein n=1 Tax=Paenibacillus mangrovi TaxID=2931978 RepID=A0A9X2B4P5_9BACL|nr:hypothetical protein [Paenibacillus mangrovi]MCJ8014849.1 hypothetical protein [Paenibacillus mangrovi]
MSESLNSITEWLDKHIQKTILIRKEEQGDLDETRVMLEGTEYKERVPSIDDYAEGNSLILHGSGSVLNKMGDFPLPTNSFQIYVDGLTECHIEEQHVSMKTDRAKYEISEIS